MGEPICEICSKSLEDDPPTRGYVMIHEECQGNNDDDTRYVIAGDLMARRQTLVGSNGRLNYG